jgi:cyclic-di-AMP phosphodiesterase PgpH
MEKTVPRFRSPRSNQGGKPGFFGTYKEMKARILWPALFVGGAGILVAALLLQFRFPGIPEYRTGEIAGQDVRAAQSIAYEDKEATAALREAARERTPALYDFDVQRIAEVERRISRGFAEGRQVLSLQKAPPRGRMHTRAQQKEILALVEKEAGQFLPPGVLPLLLQYRFDRGLEKRILNVLGPVLRGGVVADPELFRKDAARGILLREKGGLVERPLLDPSQVRSLKGAEEHLRQYHLDFAELSAVQRAELFAFMETLLFPSVTHNAPETEARREAAAARVPPVEVQIKKGKTIIRAGEEMTSRAEADLAALRNLERPRPILARLLGLFLFAAAFFWLLWRYLGYFPKRYRFIRRDAVLVATVVVLSVVAMRLLTILAESIPGGHMIGTLKDAEVLYFAVPFSTGAVLGTILLDLHLGLIVSMAAAAFAGLLYGDVYLALYALLGSLAGVYAIRQYRDRSALVKAGLVIGGVNALAACGIHLVSQDRFPGSEILVPIGMGVLSGMLAAALSSVSLPAMEWVFGITTDIRLLEMSNLNAPLLRRLAVEAPGTYHHSLMVGTLAEAAAERIGASPLLVRVGAYYHDLGKVLKPEYFTENQAAGDNKHEILAPSLSRLILASHVKDGLEMARKAGLAEQILDLIPQHHGTRIMTYFYQKTHDSPSNGREPREEDFRYPGPKPQSKEAAILMMADSVEAACRTLSRPSPAQIQRVIDRLVGEVLADHQMDECDITLGEIRIVKETFLKILTAIHHRRIDYPGYDFAPPEDIPALPPMPVSSSPRG